MIDISDEHFQELVDRAFDSLPKEHRDNVKNVAIMYADEPDSEQRTIAKLRHDQTLLGLYQGVPLANRQGQTMVMPDRITLFKIPLLSRARNEAELYDEVRHTLWHEIAHYYGLDHAGIHKLDGGVYD